MLAKDSVLRKFLRTIDPFMRIKRAIRGKKEPNSIVLPLLSHAKQKVHAADILRSYDYISKDNNPTKSYGIVWVVPSVGNGTSGGHLNIFRFIRNLEKIGYNNQTIFFLGEYPDADTNAIRHKISQNFCDINAKIVVSEEQIPECYFLIATAWQTAYVVNRSTKANKKLYFVQDFEPYFFPKGTEYLLAEDTYRFGFTAITAGSWLSDKLSKDYGMEAYPVGFGVDHNLYFPKERVKKSKADCFNIFFYARPFTARRSTLLGILALEKLYQTHKNIHVTIAGETLSSWEFSFPYNDIGSVHISKLGEIYNQCDIALVLSATNASLLPIEALSCGCVVVTNKGAWNEWECDEDTTILCEGSIFDIANKISDAISNPHILEEKRKNFITKSHHNVSWEEETIKLDNILRKLDNDNYRDQQVKG